MHVHFRKPFLRRVLGIFTQTANGAARLDSDSVMRETASQPQSNVTPIEFSLRNVSDWVRVWVRRRSHRRDISVGLSQQSGVNDESLWGRSNKVKGVAGY